LIFRAPTHFVLIVTTTIIFAISVVIWASEKQISSFQNNQLRIIQSEVQSAAGDIERFVSSRRTLVEAFAIDNSELIRSLSLTPEDDDLIAEIDARLHRWFPEHFTFTVASPDGVDLIDDIEGFVGGVCKADIKLFAEGLGFLTNSDMAHVDHAEQEIFIHPQPSNYHFDIMAPWKLGNELKGVFFVSFYPHAIQRILKNYQINQHNLAVIHRDREGLIEVSTLGTRDDISRSRDISLSTAELNLITHRQTISGSKWIVVGFPDAGLFEAQASDVRWLAFIVTVILCVLWLGSIVFASRQERARLIARAAEKEAKDSLEATVVELTNSREILDEQAANLADLAEEQSALRVKAEASEQAKSKFLAVVSHEIRTPLTAVLGMSDLLLDTALSSKQTKWANAIKTHGAGLMGLLNDILDQSKLEKGKLSIDPIDFVVRSCFEEVISLFDAKADDEGLRLILDLEEGLPRAINADNKRIKQIVSNLVSNALKFTHEGSVTVRVKSKIVDDERGLYIEVSDTGIGLNEVQIAGLFNPFQQAEKSTSRLYGGTGLGLSICKQLVELMGGKIGVFSKPDEGSTFWFTVAFDSVKDPSHLVDHENQQGKWRAVHPLSILYVEDNDVIREIVFLMLSKLKHNIQLAENGRIGVERHLKETFDLILMDARMPVLNGVEATKEIRSISGDKSAIPIIALSANSTEHDLKEFEQIGMNGFCAKPINFPELYGKINDVLGEEIHVIDEQTDAKSLLVDPTETLSQPDDPDVPEAFQDVLILVSNLFNKAKDDGYTPVVLEGLPDEVSQQMISKYLEEIGPKCKNMRAAFDAKFEGKIHDDGGELKDIVHSMKGVSGTLGYSLVSTIAAGLDDRVDVEASNIGRDELEKFVLALEMAIDLEVPGDGGKSGEILLGALQLTGAD
jgi:signal transduction histidine kinase/DNA-binding NarL/FixJ family response regulator/HPt (histidine-containing phosphotransfer) domain-containing protein